MFNLGKTQHDSVGNALKAAFATDTDADAVDAGPTDTKYHLQYGVNDDGNAINVTGIEDEAEARAVLEDLPLEAVEISGVHLLLESEAETPAEAHAELETVAESIAGTATFSDPRSFSTITVDEVDEYIADLKRRLLFWR
jgi:hypothetical protein